MFTYHPAPSHRWSQDRIRCGRASRFPWLVALSPSPWLPPATAWYRKVVEVEPVTTDRYGRAVAFVNVGGTVVNERLIRQGLARASTWYCDRSVWEGWDAKFHFYGHRHFRTSLILCKSRGQDGMLASARPNRPLAGAGQNGWFRLSLTRASDE